MLFRRRVAEGYWERIRVWLWPRRSFSRSLQYFSKRVLRLNASPHAVAAGVAAGVFSSFFPLGVHFIIAAVVSWFIAGNLVAAALGTTLANPITIPLMWGGAWETGKLMLHEHLPRNGPPAKLGAMLHDLSFSQLWKPVLEPMIVGAFPLGIAFGLLFYGITRWGMTVFREQRRKRVAEKARRRLAAHDVSHGVGSPAE